MKSKNAVTDVSKYPEHEKMKLVQQDSQIIGEFLEWMQSQQKEIGEYHITDRYPEGQFMPDGISITKRLAEYYHIDLTKVEQEKRAMLEEMKKANET